jgi:hypothetical protein
MNRVVVDQVLLQRLGDLSQPLEFRDEEGHLLGRFLPTPDPDLYTDLEPQISQVELQRRRHNKGRGYTTAEVRKHLENL